MCRAKRLLLRLSTSHTFFKGDVNMNELVRLTTQDVSKAIPITDTKAIAEYAGIEHRSVRQMVRKHEKDFSEFGNLDILCVGVEGTKGYETMYILNEMQSTLLMTYLKNTDKVREFKKRLVKEFFFKNKELQARSETRHIGIHSRKSLTDAIRDKVDEGTNFKNFAYGNYSKLVYKKVLGETVKSFKDRNGLTKNDNVRNYLTIEQLEKVQEIESKIATYLEIRKDMGENDKRIYEEVKNHIG